MSLAEIGADDYTEEKFREVLSGSVTIAELKDLKEQLTERHMKLLKMQQEYARYLNRLPYELYRRDYNQIIPPYHGLELLALQISKRISRVSSRIRELENAEYHCRPIPSYSGVWMEHIQSISSWVESPRTGVRFTIVEVETPTSVCSLRM